MTARGGDRHRARKVMAIGRRFHTNMTESRNVRCEPISATEQERDEEYWIIFPKKFDRLVRDIVDGGSIHFSFIMEQLGCN